MIDRALQPLVRAVLTPLARVLKGRGVSADQVTLIGFGIGILALPALWVGVNGLALALILLNRLADGIDGTLARLDGPTPRGAFLDIALDFAFYALVPLGFALCDPGRNALAAAVLIAAFAGTMSSFLAFAAVEAGQGGSRRGAIPGKGIAYLGGLTEGTETIALFVLICLLPDLFVPLAYIFAAACWITTLSRWVTGWTAFAPDPPPA
jgi:phosphatidylglycerophosphate synthase